MSDRSRSAWRSVMKAGDIRKPSAGPPGMGHNSSSIRIFMKPNQTDTGRPRSPTPANTFHEKAILCRAAENTCYVATVNCASAGSPTTSAVGRPDGTLMAYQPYGKPGLLVVDIDLTAATRFFATRCKPL